MLLSFKPSFDVVAIVHALLDIYERHDLARPFSRAIRVHLDEMDLPAYRSQLDPTPRLTANEQLREMEQRGFVRLAWLPGEDGHLLEAVTLIPGRAPELFPWLGRDPVAAQRADLRSLLLGDRWRFVEGDWRRLALDHVLAQLRAGKSPAPFVLADPCFNRDLLAALVAVNQVTEETPYRVFSVRTFNDSKAFETVRGALATLARRHGPGWSDLAPEEALRELGLVPNPTHIFLYGPWWLEDAAGRVALLDGFFPAAGVPGLMIARTRHVSVDVARVDRVVCVENLASFYELIRYEGNGLAALCLWGNPAPPVRRLLSLLTEMLPARVPLQVWADLDYGGLNILSGLRRSVSPRFVPYRMDLDTFDAHIRWAKPLTENDRRQLTRLLGRASLSDLSQLVEHMLQRGLKLEQEAVQLGSSSRDP
jgi:hypothetical protein